LAAKIEEYEKYLEREGGAIKKRVSNWRERLVEMLRESLLERVLHDELAGEKLERYAREVAEHKRDPYTLVEELVGQAWGTQ
jgi:putative protein kinase ArgK-like GTPase of G3E family